jgi:hypothetical protein
MACLFHVTIESCNTNPLAVKPKGSRPVILKPITAWDPEPVLSTSHSLLNLLPTEILYLFLSSPILDTHWAHWSLQTQKVAANNHKELKRGWSSSSWVGLITFHCKMLCVAKLLQKPWNWEPYKGRDFQSSVTQSGMFSLISKNEPTNEKLTDRVRQPPLKFMVNDT